MLLMVWGLHTKPIRLPTGRNVRVNCYLEIMLFKKFSVVNSPPPPLQTSDTPRRLVIISDISESVGAVLPGQRVKTSDTPRPPENLPGGADV